jgi:uncharacterized protein (DUF486 family)
MLIYLGEKWNWGYLWAICCLPGAAFFTFLPDRG